MFHSSIYSFTHSFTHTSYLMHSSRDLRAKRLIFCGFDKIERNLAEGHPVAGDVQSFGLKSCYIQSC